MCMICVEFQEGKMTKKEVLSALMEVPVRTPADNNHIKEILKMLNKEEDAAENKE